MSSAVQFETPENVQVAYQPAGLGTRFVAWFVDQIFVTLLIIVIAILLVLAGVSLSNVIDEFFKPEELTKAKKEPQKLVQYFTGLIFIVWGLGSFAYFTLAELFWHGQTIGKRMCKIRVVKSDGFALDPASVLLRNIFRVADNIPVLWVIPVMSQRSQRTGDMVGGTVVISDVAPELTDIRVQLSERKVVEAEFRFDSRSLQRLSAQDFEAVERLLERWNDLPETQRGDLVLKLTNSLAAKLQLLQPLGDNRRRFLEDLLAAELRRQSRLLA